MTGDRGGRISEKKLRVDPLDGPGLLRIDGEGAVLPFVVAEEMAVHQRKPAVRKLLPVAPFHVFRNRPAFFLGERRENGEEQ